MNAEREKALAVVLCCITTHPECRHMQKSESGIGEFAEWTFLNLTGVKMLGGRVPYPSKNCHSMVEPSSPQL
ncbi:hypothetical protein KIN20_003357 [Parelaphostrongylus tenuis]|uniref:Uncharacterized protein n=1 Tax=Parelaphostrongylus tenuis TaxID=148309 RepID=A0AAD5M022_PARTN|nr:hypothetical protein KIN20_003357 [Parelaphostrongylus tenuis]